MQLCQEGERRISELHEELLTTSLKMEDRATLFPLLLLTTSKKRPNDRGQLVTQNRIIAPTILPW